MPETNSQNRLLPQIALKKTIQKIMKYNSQIFSHCLSMLTAATALIVAAGSLQAQDKKPNIHKVINVIGAAD
jgi:hypothetical protein